MNKFKYIKIVNLYYIKMEINKGKNENEMTIIIKIKDKDKEKKVETKIPRLFLYLDLTKFICKKLNIRNQIKTITHREEDMKITIEDDIGTKIFFEKYFKKKSFIPVLEVEFSDKELNPTTEYKIKKEEEINRLINQIKTMIMDKLIKKDNFTENDRRGFICDSCQNEIIGQLFQCSECNRYYLCKKCQEINSRKLHHPHKFFIL